MTRRPWTMNEVKVLRLFASLGAAAVGDLLERPASSVAAKAQELRLSVEVTGDDIDLSGESTRLLSWVRESTKLNLCPVCSRRLARMKSTGLCRVCHLDGLLAAREEQLEVQARERRLAAARKQKQRQRVCAHCGAEFYPRETSDAVLCSGCSPSESELRP